MFSQSFKTVESVAGPNVEREGIPKSGGSILKTTSTIIAIQVHIIQ